MAGPATPRVVGSTHARSSTLSLPSRRRLALRRGGRDGHDLGDALRRQHGRRRSQPPHVQPQGARQPQGRGGHHLLGVRRGSQPDHTAIHHGRLQLVPVEGPRHAGDAGGLRRHLGEVPGRPDERPAAGGRAARGPAHAGGDRHQLLPARAVVHERRQVLDQRLPAATAGLLEGERRPVGAPLRGLGPGPVLQPERLHQGRPQPRRPADDAHPASRRRQSPQGVGQRHGPPARPLGVRGVARHGQPALRQQQQRAERPGHEAGVQFEGCVERLHRSLRARALR